MKRVKILVILAGLGLGLALAGFGAVKPAPALAAEGGSVTAVGGKAKIIYFSNLHQQNAGWAKQAIERIWPLYKNTTGVEPPGMKIYISDTFVMGKKTSDWVYGLEYNYNNKCVIIVSDLDKRETQSTLAHEAFHCWQETLGLQPYSQNEWLWEATAVWAESWVYPANNTEHEYLSAIFPTLTYDFFNDYGVREYGSYLFFYHLFQKNNFQPAKVIDLIKGLRQKNQLDLFSSWPGFYDNLKSYAFWNWNRAPFEKYKDNPLFPTIYPSGLSITLDELKKGNGLTADFPINGGGIMYWVIKIDNDIDKLVFKLDKGNKLAEPNLSLQALLKIGNHWRYEDWSEIKEKKFCRRKSGQNVKIAVLIMANAKLKPAQNQAEVILDVEGKGECPKTWSGVTTISQKQGKGGGIFGNNAELVMAEELKLIENEWGDKCWAVKKQNLSYNSQASSQLKCPFIGCSGFISQKTTESGTTERSAPADIDPVDYICRFRQEKGGEIKFDPTTEVYGDCDYVTKTETSSFNCTCPGPLGSSSESGTDTSHGLCHGFMGLELLKPVPVEIKNNQIKGEETGTNPGGLSTITVKWDYKYE